MKLVLGSNKSSMRLANKEKRGTKSNKKTKVLELMLDQIEDKEEMKMKRKLNSLA